MKVFKHYKHGSKRGGQTYQVKRGKPETDIYKSKFYKREFFDVMGGSADRKGRFLIPIQFPTGDLDYIGRKNISQKTWNKARRNAKKLIDEINTPYAERKKGE